GIVTLANVVAGGQVENLLTIDGGVEVEVKSVEGLGGVDGGAAQAQLQLLLIAPANLILQQAREELDVRPLAVDGLAVARLEGFEHARKPQPFERVRQVHDSPPSRSPTSSTALRTKICAGGAGTG